MGIIVNTLINMSKRLYEMIKMMPNFLMKILIRILRLHKKETTQVAIK